MKPASIIALIISVLLVLGGYITCSAAEKRAEKNNEFLFSEIREDDHVQKVDLTEATITKIALSVDNAEINIIGGSESSYIEFVNFQENYYSLSVANRVLNFDEIPDLISMVKFWENGFAFKGMRHFLSIFRENDVEEKDKRIDIYLTADREIKNFDISAVTCNISITNMLSATDYLINATNVTIKTDSISTTSALHINNSKSIDPATSVKLEMNDTTLTNMTIRTQNLNVDAKKFTVNGILSLSCEGGSIKIDSTVPSSLINFNLKSTGNIIVDSKPLTSPFVTSVPEEEVKAAYDLNIHSAEFIFSSPEFIQN